MDIQHALGADIMMAFDVCSAYPCDHATAEDAMHRTHRWARALPAAPHRRFAGAVRHRAGGVLRGPAHRERQDAGGYGLASAMASAACRVGEPKPIMYDMLEAIDAPHARCTSHAT